MREKRLKVTEILRTDATEIQMENPKDRREKVPKLGNLNKSEPAKQLEQVNPTHAENS